MPCVFLIIIVIILVFEGLMFLYLLYLFFNCVLCAGVLPELPHSAGQKLPPCGPETGVSAHPDGKHKVSETSKILSEVL